MLCGLVLCSFLSKLPVYAQERTNNDRLKNLQNKVNRLQKQIDDIRENFSEETEARITFGGLVRFQYAYRGYNQSNKERTGEFELDTLGLTLDTKKNNVTFSAEYRFYEYMNVLKHGWVGYEFSDHHRTQAGVTRVPFGILPYSSNNFFFSGNYYLGLEDDYDFGIKSVYQTGNWDLRTAFFKNDEIHFGNPRDRYSYDIINDQPDNNDDFNPDGDDIEENNTFNARLTYSGNLSKNIRVKPGISLQSGSLYNTTNFSSAGNYVAGAIHLKTHIHNWNLMLQYTQQDYDLDNGRKKLASGAYATTYGFPAEASTYVANIAYLQEVDVGPISQFRYYNDFSYVTDKPGTLKDTWMNVLGTEIKSGNLYTYLDLIRAENQPFVGGDLLRDGEPETRININLGYYF